VLQIFRNIFGFDRERFVEVVENSHLANQPEHESSKARYSTPLS